MVPPQMSLPELKKYQGESLKYRHLIIKKIKKKKARLPWRANPGIHAISKRGLCVPGDLPLGKRRDHRQNFWTTAGKGCPSKKGRLSIIASEY